MLEADIWFYVEHLGTLFSEANNKKTFKVKKSETFKILNYIDCFHQQYASVEAMDAKR